MIIPLTNDQLRMLKPLRNECEINFKDGKPGALFAQVLIENCEIVVSFIENESALKIQEIIGEQPVGKIFEDD